MSTITTVIESIQALYSPNGKFLAVGNSAGFGTISMFTVNTSTGTITLAGNFIPTAPFDINDLGATQLAFSPNGNFLAMANSKGGGAYAVLVYSVNQTTGNLSNPQTFNIAGSNGVNSVAYSPDGNFLAAAQSNNQMTIFSVDKTTGALTQVDQITTTNPATEVKQAVAFSPDSQYVVLTNSGSNNMFVYSIDSSTGQLTLFDGPLATGNQGGAASITLFSPLFADGTSFLSAINSGGNTVTSYAFQLCAPVEAPEFTTPTGTAFTIGTTTIRGTLADSNTVIVKSSDNSIASISNVVVDGSEWSATLTAKQSGSVVITATAINCSPFSKPKSTSVTYKVNGETNGFSSTLFEAIHKKYFLEE